MSITESNEMNVLIFFPTPSGRTEAEFPQLPEAFSTLFMLAHYAHIMPSWK
jgi:hypothetical protein